MRPPTTTDENGVLVVTFDDPAALNDGRSDAYREAVYKAVDGSASKLVAADLQPVDYLSSSGLAILVGVKRRVDARHGKFVLYQVHPYVHDVLRITRLIQFFSVAPDRESAMAMLSPPPA